MSITVDQRPEVTTMRVAPFPSAISRPENVVSVDEAVRATLDRWGGMWNADIHPSQAAKFAQTEHTVYASENLPHSSNVFMPRVQYYEHDWTVDPSSFFAAAERVQLPGVTNRQDTITGAQLTKLFTSFDADHDGQIRPNEYDAISKAVGETWHYAGNSVDTD